MVGVGCGAGVPCLPRPPVSAVSFSQRNPRFREDRHTGPSDVRDPGWQYTGGFGDDGLDRRMTGSSSDKLVGVLGGA